MVRADDSLIRARPNPVARIGRDATRPSLDSLPFLTPAGRRRGADPGQKLLEGAALAQASKRRRDKVDRQAVEHGVRAARSQQPRRARRKRRAESSDKSA